MTDLIDKYTPETIERKTMFEINRLRKGQIDELSRKIDSIDCDRSLDEDSEATIRLMALKKLLAVNLNAWKQFRTKNGLDNSTVNDLY